MILRRKVILRINAAIIMLMAVLLCACNAQKKNTAATRQYTGFITRYNILYNGDTHYKETLNDMETKYEDDYSRNVFMHPVEAKSDPKSPQPSGDFTRSIEKAQKAIQIRSIKKKPAKKNGKGNDPEYKAWMKRDEYNPVMHNAWMLMGRSQYYNGDFLGAASTFYYVSKHFTWLPSTVTEARLWQALSYVSLDWLYEAEVIITRIKPAELTSSSLKALYNYTWADFLVKSKEYEKAIPYLTEAIDHTGGAQKTRLRFLLGQLYANLGDKARAYEAFGKAGSSASASYRTKFNARIKQSEVFSGQDITPEVKALRRMTRYDRNKDYLDQIYYAIGNLYLSRGDTTNAIDNYELAAAKSTRGGVDKAISQITLGSLYFDRHNYEKAQPCFSEAIPLLPETYPGYALLKRRSDVLDELSVYSQNVNLQDSLLHLASLPEDERLAVIDKIIENLKAEEKKAAEEAAMAEYLANQSATGNKLQDNNQREFSINTDKSWYFYNATSKASGKTEFQKRWGSRKLEDNWRRRNKTMFDTSDFDSDSDEDENEDNRTIASDTVPDTDKPTTEAANDPHNREFYLKQIPFTDEEKTVSREVIQEGLYNMGIILKDKLDDYPAALAEFERLLTEYPDNVYRLDVYYNLYLMFMRQGEQAEAERYRQLILSDFADSKYGLALKDPAYIENLKKMEQVQNQLYDETYEAYLDNDNTQVHDNYAKMKQTYPLSPLMPKFMFLEALAYVTDRNAEKFNSTLREMLELYPDTELTTYASSWLKGMARGRKLQSPENGNLRGMLWDIHLGGDSTALAMDSVASFELDNDAPQLLVLVYATDEVPANALLYEVARHNFSSFVVRDFDLEQMNFGRLGMLVIKGFDNLRQLNHYRKVMNDSEDFQLPAEVTPVPISEKNFQMLLTQGRTFEEYFRFLQKNNYEDPQLQVLGPDEVETLEEREAEDENIPDDTDVPEDSGLPGLPELPDDTDITDITDDSPEPEPDTMPAQTPSAGTVQAAGTTPDTVTTPAAEPEELDPGSEGDDPLFE